MLKVLAHAAAIIGLYLAFSFVLFLGLQVNPVYGNIGLVAVAGLVALYVYLGGRGETPAAFDRRCIPPELRCSSLTYWEYARSLRLERAVRSVDSGGSRCDAGFHHGLLGFVRK